MKEDWASIDRFPAYMVSNFGNVVNIRTGNYVRPRPNKEGLATVSLYMGSGKHTYRSLAVVVAEAFVPRQDPHFNSPVNLDGDKFHCHVDNLKWRPRWYAMQFRKQFDRPEFYDPCPLELIETNERFDGWATPAMIHGIRFVDIIMSCISKTPTMITKQHYRYL